MVLHRQKTRLKPSRISRAGAAVILLCLPVASKKYLQRHRCRQLPGPCRGCGHRRKPCSNGGAGAATAENPTRPSSAQSNRPTAIARPRWLPRWKAKTDEDWRAAFAMLECKYPERWSLTANAPSSKATALPASATSSFTSGRPGRWYPKKPEVIDVTPEEANVLGKATNKQ